MDKESAVESRRRFGLKLQDLRESQGISVEGLAQTTRISEPFIKALEAGDFEKLPGQVFGRGFVRSLIKTMGADEKEWTVAYNEASGPIPVSDVLGKGLHARGSSPSYGSLTSGPRITNHIGLHHKEGGLAKNFSSSFPRSPKGPRSPRSRRNLRSSRNSRYSGKSRTLRNLVRLFPYWVAGPLVVFCVLGMMTMAVAILGKIGFDQPIAQFWSSLRSRPFERQETLVPATDIKTQSLYNHLVEELRTPLLYREAQEFLIPHAASKWLELERPVPMLPDSWPTPLLLVLPQQYWGPIDSSLGTTVEWTLPFGILEGAQGGEGHGKRLQSLSQGPENSSNPQTPVDGGSIANNALPIDSSGGGRTRLEGERGQPNGDMMQPGVQEISLVVLETVKVKVGFDGSPMKMTELKPDSYRYKFKDRADLLVYDAGLLSIQFNGKDVGPLGQKGRIRRLTFKADQDPVAED